MPLDQHRRRGAACGIVLLLGLSVGSASAGPQEPATPSERWLAAQRGPDQKRYFGEPISLSLKDADLVEVLRSFAELGDFNLILQPGIRGTVTVELKDVPWDQALAQILKINGLGMEITGGKVRIGRGLAHRAAPTPSTQAMVTVRLQLKYADAAVVARALHRPQAGVPNPGGLIEAEPARNHLVLRDQRSALRDFGRVLTYIDVPSAAEEDPLRLERRCIELWDRIVSGQTGQ